MSGAPFDLHVLSTPPAFILSQDQTLWQNLLAQAFACFYPSYCLGCFCSFLFLFSNQRIFRNSFIVTFVTCMIVCFAVQLSKCFYCFVSAVLWGVPRASSIIISWSHMVVNIFFHFFHFFHFFAFCSKNLVPETAPKLHPIKDIRKYFYKNIPFIEK